MSKNVSLFQHTHPVLQLVSRHFQKKVCSCQFTVGRKNFSNSLNLQLTIKDIKAIPTSDYPTPAIRPMNSQLALTKLESVFSLKMPGWRNELELCIENLKKVISLQ